MSGFRVVLDVERIAADLCVAEERPVRVSEVLALLRRLGFLSIESGEAWFTNAHCLAQLKSRIGPNANPFRTQSPLPPEAASRPVKQASAF